MTFSTEIKQNVVAIFVTNEMLSCLPCFVNKNVDINFRSVLICFYIFNDNWFFLSEVCLWDEDDNVVLHCNLSANLLAYSNLQVDI
jgi:SAM-dependent MidA family methyltransferase